MSSRFHQPVAPVTLAAGPLRLVPLTLALFGQVSLSSPLANAVAIPVVSLVVTPLVHALAARALDAEVEIHFAGPAVRWLIEGMAATSKADYDNQTNNISMSMSAPGLKVSLDDQHLPHFTFPAGYDPADPASRIRYEKTLSNIQEVKAREGIVIGIINEGDEDARRMCSYAIEIPTTSEMLLPLLEL